jgi:hypothetical protein
LTGLIAFQNMSSKFNSALAVPPQGFCSFPVAVDPIPPVEPGHPKGAGAHQETEADKNTTSSQANRGASTLASGAGDKDSVDPTPEGLGIGAAAHPGSAGPGLRSR